MDIKDFTIYQMVDEINQYLIPIIGEKNIYDWWDSPNKALNWKTPLNSLPAEYDVLLHYIKQAYDKALDGEL
jgi:hypothetical protein